MRSTLVGTRLVVQARKSCVRVRTMASAAYVGREPLKLATFRTASGPTVGVVQGDTLCTLVGTRLVVQARKSCVRVRTMASAAYVGREPLKLATFRTASGPTVGVVQGDTLCPLKGVGTMRELVEKFGSERPSVDIDESAAVPLSAADWLPPLVPGSILCVGKNYLEHVKEVDSSLPGISKEAIPEHPIIFTKAPGCLASHLQEIKYPHGVSTQVDYEGELAVVIGKGGLRISREDAMDHVFGYTVLNDVTARDLQKRHQQWYLGKSLDTFCPMGPWIVPAADVDDSKLTVRTFVNGELRQNAPTTDLIFSIATLIEVISEGITLYPGDVIATGTPAGVGAGFKPPKFLQPGDVVRVFIDGVGELENVVGE